MQTFFELLGFAVIILFTLIRFSLVFHGFPVIIYKHYYDDED